MKSEILKLRSQIYQNLKNKALSYEMGNAEIDKYLQNQQQFATREFAYSDMSELISAAENADVIFIGDFHTFDQNIRNVLRLVRAVLAQNQDCLIGLEMVAHQHQLYIDSFLEGHITELEFLESIKYHDSWRFPWSHYKLIFELAKEHKIRLVGLNKQGTLQQRDVYASELIEKYHGESNSKMIILYGELHISLNKIPALTMNKLPYKKQLILHQNLDEVYWKILNENKEQAIVKYSPNEFCIISAPPWIKYESMIYWYENLCDDPEFDIHEYIIENGKKIFSEDTHENFFHICEQITTHLNLKVNISEMEDYNLYDHTNLEYVEDQLTNSLDKKQRQFYEYLIASSRSFRFLGNNYYCSSYSLNRISYLAGIHFLHHYLKNRNILPITLRQQPESFLMLCTWEAVFAYYFSKIINPHRKCEMYKDIQLKSSIGTASSKKASALTLSLLHLEKATIKLEQFSLPELYETALNLGHILGEYLYILSSENKIHIEAIVQKLEFELNNFIALKQDLLSNFDFQNHQKRYF